MTTVSIVGLGKLGSPMAAVLANGGVNVIGYDVRPEVVGAVNAGVAPVDEVQLQSYIDSNRGRIRATSDLAEAINSSEVTFVIVPTPSDDDGVFTNAYVEAALRQIGSALRAKNGYHNVVVSSTVMPGSMAGPLREAIESASGRKVGKDLGFCYNPEFIALGSVIRDMESPDVILIGESDAAAGDQLEAIHATYLRSRPVVRRMNWVNAEITKIAINTFVTTKISFANMVSGLCDTLEGAESDVVTAAVGSDTRIGSKYLKGAVAYGGPCFPRDNKAFAVLGRRQGVPMDLAEATDTINDWQTDRLVGVVRGVCEPGSLVAVLGMAYKAGTAVCEASQGVSLANRLHAEGFVVKASDPAAFSGDQPPALVAGIATTSDHATAIANVAAIVVTTPWENYKQLSCDSETILLVDPWSVVQEVAGSNVAVVRPGVGAKQ